MRRQFPAPKPIETAWDGPTIYRENGLSVEAAFVDHTVPCLAFALVEEPGTYLDAARLAAGPLPAGPWIGEAQKLLAAARTSGDARRGAVLRESAPAVDAESTLFPGHSGFAASRMSPTPPGARAFAPHSSASPTAHAGFIVIRSTRTPSVPRPKNIDT